ncbi:hypothetical protein JW960_14295 [candidate division KSB1 bacterium]|nr:hypothetical protein [candidate division KSB1 bacterium]
MKRTLCLFILITATTIYFWRTPAFSQNTKNAKPDTSKAKPNLELQDVIIYGTDKSLRTTGTKLQPGEEHLRLFKRPIDYQPTMDGQPLPSGKATVAEQTTAMHSLTLVSLGYGQLSTPDVQAMHWQQFDAFNYGLDANFAQSDGEYINSQFQRMSGSGHVGIQFQPEMFGEIRGIAGEQTFGLYGARVPTMERNAVAYAFSGALQTTLQAKHQLNAMVSWQRVYFSDAGTVTDTTSALSDERTGSFMVSYQAPLPRRMQLNLAVNSDFISTPEIDSSWQVMNYTADLLIPIGTHFSIRPALVYEFVSNYTTRMSPGMEFVYTPSTRFGISAKANRQLQLRSVRSLEKQNPYIATSVIPIVQDIMFNGEGTAELKLSSQLTARASLSAQQIADYAYWQRDSNGMFMLNTLNEITITTAGVAATYDISPNQGFQTGFYYVIDNSDVDAIPYLEDFRIPFELTMQLPYHIGIQASAIWMGTRYADLAATQKLVDYVTGSFRVEKQLGKHMTLYSQIDNANDSNYEVWQGYPAFGFYTLIGISGKW